MTGVDQLGRTSALGAGVGFFAVIEPHSTGRNLIMIGVRRLQGIAVTLSFQSIAGASYVEPILVRHVPSYEGVPCAIMRDRCHEEFVGDPHQALSLLGDGQGELVEYLKGLL